MKPAPPASRPDLSAAAAAVLARYRSPLIAAAEIAALGPAAIAADLAASEAECRQICCYARGYVDGFIARSDPASKPDPPDAERIDPQLPAPADRAGYVIAFKETPETALTMVPRRKPSGSAP